MERNSLPLVELAKEAASSAKTPDEFRVLMMSLITGEEFRFRYPPHVMSQVLAEMSIAGENKTSSGVTLQVPAFVAGVGAMRIADREVAAEKNWDGDATSLCGVADAGEFPSRRKFLTRALKVAGSGIAVLSSSHIRPNEALANPCGPAGQCSRNCL